MTSAEELGPLPTIHPRERVVEEAERKIELAITEATRELTEYEQISVVNAVSSRFFGGIAKYGIRRERHGNADKPGGLM